MSIVEWGHKYVLLYSAVIEFRMVWIRNIMNSSFPNYIDTFMPRYVHPNHYQISKFSTIITQSNDL